MGSSLAVLLYETLYSKLLAEKTWIVPGSEFRSYMNYSTFDVVHLWEGDHCRLLRCEHHRPARRYRRRACVHVGFPGAYLDSYTDPVPRRVIGLGEMIEFII